MKIGLSNPFNYTGSKHRYLNELNKIITKENNVTVLDPFFGGGDLSMHLNKTWAVDAADTCQQLMQMHHDIMHGIVTVDAVISLCANHGIGANKDLEYYEFRKKYNENKTSLGLYALICHANSNRMRFSSRKGEFNMSSGKKYRWFNDKMQLKLDDYLSRLAETDIDFYTASAFDFDFRLYDLVLLDPPYCETCATYNETGCWSKKKEVELICKIKLECKSFVYFGQTWSKGVFNKNVADFAGLYNCKILDSKKRISHNRKLGKTVDVMIYS